MNRFTLSSKRPIPTLPPLEFGLQRRYRRNGALQRIKVLMIVVPRRPAVPLALDAHPHRPPTALLLLEIAHSLFSRHVFSFLLIFQYGS